MDDEQRMSFIDHIGVVVAEVVREEIEDHETRMHLCSGSEQQDERIPDRILAKIADTLRRIRTRHFAMSMVSAIYGYPQEQVAREVEEWDRKNRLGGEQGRASA